MEKNVEYLQEALEKSQKELREKDQQMQFLMERLEMLKEDLERDALEHGQQLHVYREQLQKMVQELQEAHSCCESLNRQIQYLTEEKEFQQLQEERSAMEKRSTQAELSALQQKRGQLLKMSDQISSSLRNSQEQLSQRLQQARDQLEEARSTSLPSESANETLLIKESKITRLQAKLSSFERATELYSITLRHKPSTLPRPDLAGSEHP